jgi:hypothetical protein
MISINLPRSVIGVLQKDSACRVYAPLVSIKQHTKVFLVAVHAEFADEFVVRAIPPNWRSC